MGAERPWRIVASLAVSSVACAILLMVWVPTILQLWELATFTPLRPIRPVILGMLILIGVPIGIFVGAPLAILASELSDHRAAGLAAGAVLLMSFAPVLNFFLSIAIILIRGIEFAE